MRVDSRAVSVPLGVVLLFAIVVMGVAVVVTVGATALDDTRGQMDVERAEKILTQFDSKSALVALGETESQGVTLARDENAQFSLDDDAGWMNVTVTDPANDTVEQVVNVSLGAVKYENGRTTLAYQGGGVWHSTDGGARMVSPPEFHFRDATLTLPLISVDGDRSLDGTARVSKRAATGIRYPNTTTSPRFENPLEDGVVNVTVQSDYYRAWGNYFETRTDGNVSYDAGRETATATLVVPFNEGFDNIVATTEPGGIKPSNKNSKVPEPSETGVAYPLADSRIESQVEECETNPSACTNVSGDVTITSPGTYYNYQKFGGNLDVQNPGGNVTVVVEGNFQPSSVEIDITDEHTVTVLVRKSFSTGENSVNGDGDDDLGDDADDLVVAMHSDGAFNGNGKFRFVGLLYAPGSDCNLNGGGGHKYENVIGGVICEEITINGKPNKFVYDDSIENVDMNLDGDETKITFLHVTVNRVEVSD